MAKKIKKTISTEIPMQQIPIENDGYHLTIPARINGKKARLLIDTGASRTVFDKNRILPFLKEQEAEFEENEQLSTAMGTNQLQSQIFILDRLKLGDLKIRDYPAILLDMVHVNHSYEKLDIQPIDGVLGGDILSRYKAVIYYKTNKLKLYFKD
ncbi:MAG: retroviral-like aspartic protease family protein [Bacteroidales bacterium]|nr:retroviral-like aspartic protease family protein [Bacteroidales bacterium]MCF8351240.1 retroviral-like aspartic protease family protein [Bacteroidales bacterium]MCF8377609.1 retroviral-like aspartic protease family protein [Bacteroidales bacterium]MCF8401898.1 retroviral-like aspartic protease family protein [Bacteroidales bacterium]